MCSISGIFGPAAGLDRVRAMVRAQAHRGPDAEGVFQDEAGLAALGHGRLAVIDLSDCARQPLSSADGRYQIAFNGEVYNYLELRRELSSYPYRSRSDTEVVLAAYERWGPACLDRFIGMFAFLIWDSREKSLFAARDRFGVKPLYYHLGAGGELLAASEIKALHAAGAPKRPDEASWAAYLKGGLYDHGERTFWDGILALAPGSSLAWKDGRLRIFRWYDIAERLGPELDQRPEEEVREEYWGLLKESVKLRFRSDVPVGVNLSAGLDSALLLALVHEAQGGGGAVKAFTFVTGDPSYDELSWVEKMLARTRHSLIACPLSPGDVPALALSVQSHADGPYGGLPTLAYARLFERARGEGTVVLLDAQGMDEQWAGYDYYGA
ncbi:MAG: asparagine synthase (glutamine-hydrolyzing), partial [Elusimicrobia bacterium]|nr:asparagine synthase (glutamine-hydrolyzing) [Elusimicrobiota bacterium]